MMLPDTLLVLEELVGREELELTGDVGADRVTIGNAVEYASQQHHELRFLLLLPVSMYPQLRQVDGVPVKHTVRPGRRPALLYWSGADGRTAERLLTLLWGGGVIDVPAPTP